MSSLALFRALGFFAAENFFSADDCARIRDVMRESPSETAQIYTAAGVETDDRIRRTRSVKVPPANREEITSRLGDARDRVAAHFGVTLSKMEGPVFLTYRSGDFFLRHTDRNDDDARGRQVSFIAFLNSDFDGGTLKFYGGVKDKPLELALRAQDGLLIGFRSDWLHEVEPVSSGERHTVVGWFV